MEALLVRAFLSFLISEEKENVTVFSGEASDPPAAHRRN
jgi:hypothetical protein